LSGGPILLLTNGFLRLNAPVDQNWSLTNDIAGINTITVEGGTTNYGLTAAGSTINPGTNAVGTLTVDGNFEFGKKGSTFATLVTCITGPGTNDLFRVLDGTTAVFAPSLTNCNLQVNLGALTAEALASAVFTNIFATGVVFSASSPFNSVTWNSDNDIVGTVTYTTNQITLSDFAGQSTTGIGLPWRMGSSWILLK
jgi:hypothetical protein